MSGIDYSRWTPVPNQEIDNLCHDKHVPVKVRVRWAIIRMILGFKKNRAKMTAAISYTTLAKKTDANLRTVKRIVKEIESENGISILRGCGRGNRNVYRLDFNCNGGHKR